VYIKVSPVWLFAGGAVLLFLVAAAAVAGMSAATAPKQAAASTGQSAYGAQASLPQVTLPHNAEADAYYEKMTGHPHDASYYVVDGVDPNTPQDQKTLPPLTQPNIPWSNDPKDSEPSASSQSGQIHHDDPIIPRVAGDPWDGSKWVYVIDPNREIREVLTFERAHVGLTPAQYAVHAVVEGFDSLTAEEASECRRDCYHQATIADDNTLKLYWGFHTYTTTIGPDSLSFNGRTYVRSH
jgi:hypothetical protein